MRSTLLFLLFAVLAVTSSNAQESTDWDWANHKYKSLFDEYFPLEEHLGAVISFRYNEALMRDQLEYSFSFSRDYRSGAINAVFRKAVSRSLYGQLLDNHLKDKSESIENIKAKIHVTVHEYSQDNCPALKTLFARFYKIRLEQPSPYTIILDPPNYEFEVSSLAGYAHFIIHEKDNPFVKWAYNVAEKMESCSLGK